MDFEMLSKKKLTDLRELAKLAGVKSVTVYRKPQLIQKLRELDQAAGAQSPACPLPCPQPAPPPMAEGILEIHAEGYGFLRKCNYLPGNEDVYVPAVHIRKLGLRAGDCILGKTRPPKGADRSVAMLYIHTINGCPVRDCFCRPSFEALTPIFPEERYTLQGAGAEAAARLIDLIAPIGKGQRGLIVAPPKAGKTTILKTVANRIAAGYPEAHLLVLLIDERPEEVTDMQRSIRGEVAYSTFDERPENHVRVAEMAIERAKRLVEQGRDVVLLLDSITRLTRAYNLTVPPSGRTLSGGLDPAALHKPKRFFGAARNIEGGGSLTILATALVETGSRMDDVIYEEFKGTGNLELQLDRRLAERRVFPAIDISRSGTRREEQLMSEAEREGAWRLRRLFGETADGTEQLLQLLESTADNEELLSRAADLQRGLQKQGYKLKNPRY